MWSLAVSIASATRSTESGRVRWEVDQLTRQVYVRSLTAALAPDEAERLRAASDATAALVGTQGLSTDARLMLSLLGPLEPEAAEAALQRLPVALRQRLTASSPVTYLDEITAPLIVIGHDRDDTVIPVDESRQLVAALAGRGGVRYTEFGLFQHMDPTTRRLPPRQLLRELGSFYRYVYQMVRHVVSSSPVRANADAPRAVGVASVGDGEQPQPTPSG
jgi:hypothetical protein